MSVDLIILFRRCQARVLFFLLSEYQVSFRTGGNVFTDALSTLS